MTTQPNRESSLFLEVSGLRTYFMQAGVFVRAVDDVDFIVRNNEILGIVGESGSGKSVSVLSVLGIPGGRPGVIQGSLKIEGREYWSRLPEFCSVESDNGNLVVRKNDLGWERYLNRELKPIRGKKIAMIFQEPTTSLDPYYRIGDQIAEYVKRHTGVKDKKALQARVIQLLNLVSLDAEEFSDRYPHTLSGGQCQRAMIALALASQPQLLIADEPTTYLDPGIQLKILALLKKLTEDSTLRLSLVLISHDIAIIRKFSSRLMVMFNGRVMELRDTQELVQSQDAAIHPYTELLLEGKSNLGKLIASRSKNEPESPKPASKHYHSRSNPRPSKKRSSLLVSADLPVLKGCRYQHRCPHVMGRCLEAEPNLFPVTEGHAIRCYLFDPKDS